MNLSAEQNLAFKNSEGFPPVYSYASIFIFLPIYKKKIMWTYVDFAVFSRPVVQLHHVSDKRIESNQ